MVPAECEREKSGDVTQGLTNDSSYLRIIEIDFSSDRVVKRR